MSFHKSFLKLMGEGKIKEAMKKINNDQNAAVGVLDYSAEIKEILERKHPKGREANPNVIISGATEEIQTVIFEDITLEMVQKVAQTINGSGGPTLVDADS